MRPHDPLHDPLFSERGTDVAGALEVDQLNVEAGSLWRRNPLRALELAQTALSLAERLDYSHGQLRALLTLAHCALDTADYAVAERQARRAQAVALELGASQARAAAGVVLGVVFTRHGDFEAALEAHGASAALYRELGDRSGEAEALMYTGGVYLDLTRHAEAHGYLTQALDIFTAEANLSGQMQARLMLGITAGALGELAASFQHHLLALELSEQQGDLLTQLRVLNNLVNSYDLSGASDKALTCYLRALELTEVLDNPQMRAALLVNVANTYLNLGELDRAVSYAAEALELSGKRGYLRDQAEALGTLGQLYLLKNEPERAEGCFRGALETAQAAADPHAQAASLTSLAELAQQRGQFETARELFEASIATARPTTLWPRPALGWGWANCWQLAETIRETRGEEGRGRATSCSKPPCWPAASTTNGSSATPIWRCRKVSSGTGLRLKLWVAINATRRSGGSSHTNGSPNALRR